ncbi:MAG TPA: ATP-binding protein [Gammaproteobacteria bacterium]|nr:ATP-binding protein [Gammaproteobacteria bacterium]
MISLLPKSLFGRLLAGLLAVIALTILIVALLIVRDRREFVFWGDGRAAAVTTIQEITDTIEATPVGDRDTAIAAIAQDLSESFSDERRSAPPPARNLRTVVAAYERRIARALGDEYQVSITRARRSAAPVIELNAPRRPVRRELPADVRGQRRTNEANGFGRAGRLPPRGLDIAVTFPDEYELVFRTDLPRNPPAGRNVIFLQLGLLTLMLTGALFFVARAITRPLSNLARAAEGIGRGENRQPVPERGAREIRDTTRAFNTMRERLQRYLDSRADTLAAMSHDLRTPLTRLRLRLEKISDEELRTQCAKDLEEMSALITGTLSFFRSLNDDGPDARLERVDVNLLCEELRKEFAATGQAFTIEGSATHAVTGKRLALKRCLENLISNAMRFADNVSVHIEDSDDVAIRVRDDGPGIPPQELENVFRPFYRIEASRNTDSGGAGLGLAIARDIAQSHGGTVTLRNCLPGLEATLRLPHALS